MNYNNREIERKFTIKGYDYRIQAYEMRNIRQGLLNTHGKNEVRVTIRDQYAWICIKSNEDNINRFEWEHPISVEEAETLLKTCCVSRIIEKTRYMVLSGEGLIWEVDEFHGDDEGLVIAEIEVPSKDYEIEIPEWVDEEVTGNRKYYNHTLCLVSWKDQSQYEEDWSEFMKMNRCG